MTLALPRIFYDREPMRSIAVLYVLLASLVACGNEPTMRLGEPCSADGVLGVELRNRREPALDDSCPGRLCAPGGFDQCPRGEPCSLPDDEVNYCTYGNCLTVRGTPCDEGYTCVVSRGEFCQKNEDIIDVRRQDAGI